MTLRIWTIGHSNHAPDRLVELLRQHEIDTVVDVRSYPYSKFAPQFNREPLAAYLKRAGVRYAFRGEALGGRPTNDDQYDEEGHALYEPMSREPAFQHAITRLLAGIVDNRVALMCSEGDPGDCHRRLLVGRILTERGVELHHVLSDGTEAVEDLVPLPADQQSLFEGGPQAWRSTRSVSRRRRLSTSSGG